MSEETTENLNVRQSFESRVLAELANIGGRLSSLETRMSSLEAKFDGLEVKVDRLEAKVDRLETKVDALEARVERVENRVTALEGRMTSLEEKVDARLQETRPIWEAVLSRLELIDSKLHVLNQDMLEMRGEVNLLKKRQPPAA